jgi:hypothetical protein
MQWEGALHADSIGDLTYHKRGIGGAFPFPNDNPLKDLNPLLVPFLDLNVNLDGIARLERRQVKPNLFIFNSPNNFHIFLQVYLAVVDGQKI